MRRESSTSLVHQGDEHEEHSSHDPRRIKLLSGEHLPDGEDYGYFSPKVSRIGSRVGSRVHSARNSRQGSRVGSRPDLMLTAALRSSDVEEEHADLDGVMEPDFINGGEESDGDEVEVARLARQRGFGLGGWVDRLIDWSLFSVKEDGEESDYDTDGHSECSSRTTVEESKLRKEVELKRRKMEREAIIEAAAVKTDLVHGPKVGENVVEQQPPPNEGSTWQDAAWLLSVASKVLL